MKKLDVYLSNLAVGNIKLHNLHWNLEGLKFKEIHEYLEDLYNEAFEYLDEVAELQKMHGEVPISTMKGYLDNTSLEELQETKFTYKEAIELAIDYVKSMHKLALEVREEAEKEDKFTVANLMEDHVTAYIKHEWFLESMLK